MEQIEQIENSIAGNRAEYSKQVEAINKDSSLSEQGKRSKIGELYEIATTRHEELKKERLKAISDTQTDLRKKAFNFGSTPTDQLAFDQAVFNFMQSNPEERSKRMTLASEPTAKALAMASYYADDMVTLNTYVQRYPSAGNVIEKLVTHDRTYTEKASKEQRISQNMKLTAPQRPR